MKLWEKINPYKSSPVKRVSDRPNQPYRLPVSARIVMGLMGLIAVGTLLLMIPAMSTEAPLTFREAIFTSISALTVTGLSIITAGTDLTRTGQIVLLLLIQFGGVGYMVIATLIMRFIGRRVFVLDRIALSNSIGLDSPEDIMHVLRHVIRGIIVIEVVGAVVLYLHWSLNSIVPQSDVIFLAVFHSISAFCNAGFDLFGNASLFPSGMPKDNLTLLILGTIIFIGGLGIPVLSEFFANHHFKRWSLHTRVTMLVVTGLVLFGWVFTFWAEAGALGVLHDAGLGKQLARSWFHSISSRTAGFAAFDSFDQIRPATQILTICLMFIGCAPASMGGGLTTGTFAVLWAAVLNYTRGHSEVRVMERRVSRGTVRRAGSVLTISIGLVMGATFFILLTHPTATVDQVLFEVVSAFATCGLSLDFTGQLNNFGLGVISVMMIWGRLGALTIVTAIMQTSRQDSGVRYPEETLLIG